MEYRDAAKYLAGKVKFGIKPGLERIAALCEALGNPHDSYRVIQVTGTNGKTSVAKLIAAILSAHGVETGVYTSPHLESYTERIGIGNCEISGSEFSSFLNQIIPQVEAISSQMEEPLTHFEILTGLAFKYFSEQKVDCAVLEVGMGGRWDATSVIVPEVAVITNVELEHTDRLGETIAEIASEKAHVIKKGTQQGVAGCLNPVALQIVRDRCAHEGASLKVLDCDFLILSFKGEREKDVSIKGLFKEYQGLILPAFGVHQVTNLSLAVVAAETYLNRPLEEFRIGEALTQMSFPGRLEVVRENPWVVLDGAHNPAGFDALFDALFSEFSFKRLIPVLGVLKEKDIKSMLSKLVPEASLTILSQNSNDRCAEASYLAEHAKELNSQLICEPNLKKAIDIALKSADENDLICITGSLYTVGEARSYLMQ